MNILIVEDEIHLAEALAQIFAKQKYSVHVEEDGQSGLDEALTGIYDVIVLDVMLPKLYGFEVLRVLRQEHLTTPVLLLTARDEVADKVKGLDLGADDYLTKPFSTEELLARVRALCRRETQLNCDQTLHFGDITLNLATYELQCGSQSVKLGLKEFELMRLLLHNGSQVVSKEGILEKVWGFESDAEYNNVEVYISFLRKKLIFLHVRTVIRTLRGVGYYLEEEA